MRSQSTRFVHASALAGLVVGVVITYAALKVFPQSQPSRLRGRAVT